MAGEAYRQGIKKLGPQHYRLRVHGGKRADGGEIVYQETVHGSLADAKVKRDELRARAADRLEGDPRQSLESWLRYWLEVKAKDSSKSPATLKGYRAKADSLIVGLGNIRMKDLSPQHIAAYYAKCATEPAFPERVGSHRKKPAGHTSKLLSPTTIHARHVVLNMALKMAVRKRVIPTNPIDLLEPEEVPSKAKHEPLAPDATQAAAVLRAAEGTDFEALVWLGIHTGARLGELLALRWSDLDFDSRTMHIRRTLIELSVAERVDSESWWAFKTPKSKESTRAVILDPGTVTKLRAHRAHQNRERLANADIWLNLDLVFPGAFGEPRRVSRTSADFKTIARVAGLNDLTFHGLRHGHASIALDNGENPVTVSKRLGHSTVSFTMDRYAHELEGQQDALATRFAEGIDRALSS